MIVNIEKELQLNDRRMILNDTKSWSLKLKLS